MNSTYSNNENLILSIALAEISFLTFLEKNILRKNIDSLSTLSILSIQDISRIVNRDITRSSWNGKQSLAAAKKSAKILDSFGITLIPYESENYPALLKEIVNPPYALFCRGNVSSLLECTVSVVGTRKMTLNGKKGARAFSEDACKDGLVVVSGLAVGIDAEAHRGTLEYGKTIAVLPCGCDMIVPSIHKVLAKKIIEAGGALISEYIPGTPSTAWRFVHRNRVIAALSPSTVVVEAPVGSGALHTAQFALDYNRDVFFHKAAFEYDALSVSKKVQSRLEISSSMRNTSSAKLKNTAERYILEGAPIIKDYADFVESRLSSPGTRLSIAKQGILL
ncbi:MAG: DNA-processing protein DprA [Treponema sp.]|nr:DNA-processing protein DprA [Treponema sp.]